MNEINERAEAEWRRQALEECDRQAASRDARAKPYDRDPAKGEPWRVKDERDKTGAQTMEMKFERCVTCGVTMAHVRKYGCGWAAVDGVRCALRIERTDRPVPHPRASDAGSGSCTTSDALPDTTRAHLVIIAADKTQDAQLRAVARRLLGVV